MITRKHSTQRPISQLSANTEEDDVDNKSEWHTKTSECPAQGDHSPEASGQPWCRRKKKKKATTEAIGQKKKTPATPPTVETSHQTNAFVHGHRNVARGNQWKPNYANSDQKEKELYDDSEGHINEKKESSKRQKTLPSGDHKSIKVYGSLLSP